MRTLLCILSALTILLVGCGQPSLDTAPSRNTAKSPLSLYIVSEAKEDGYRFIDTPDFPKLGYIAPTPDLVITQLVSVNLKISSSRPEIIIDASGNQTTGPMRGNTNLDVSILPEDSKKFEILTSHAVGKKILVMLGDMPLMAPNVVMPIAAPGFQMTFGKHDNQAQIENELKELVQ